MESLVQTSCKNPQSCGISAVTVHISIYISSSRNEREHNMMMLKMIRT